MSALQLYRQLISNANRFNTWNFREYAKRRTREEFRKYRSETDPKIINELIREGWKQNEIVRRQALINSMYSKDDLIINLPNKK